MLFKNWMNTVFESDSKLALCTADAPKVKIKNKNSIFWEIKRGFKNIDKRINYIKISLINLGFMLII